MKEKDIALIWENLSFDINNLKTISGLPLKILSQGRYNGSLGADFVDAIIKIGDFIEFGNIEIHYKSSDWYSHKHNNKQKYNNTILHVVFIHDLKEITSDKRDNKTIEILELCNIFDKNKIITKNFNKCYRLCYEKIRSLDFEKKIDYIMKESEDRFKRKTNEFKESFIKKSYDEVLFHAIASSIAYGRNSEKMKLLAEKLPFDELRNIIYGGNEQVINERIEAYLFIKAGLIEKVKNNNEIYDIYKTHIKSFSLWEKSPKPILKYSDWQINGIRPNNSIYRQVASLSSLYKKYLHKNLFSEFLKHINTCLTSNISINEEELYKVFNNILNSNETSIWQYYLTPSSKKRNDKIDLFSNNKIIVISINIFFPFINALPDNIISEKDKMRIYNCYENFYPEQSNNKIEFILCQLDLEKKKIPKNAKFMQGLIEIYKKSGDYSLL